MCADTLGRNEMKQDKQKIKFTSPQLLRGVEEKSSLAKVKYAEMSELGWQ
jgi:hypothetical protein